MPLQTGKETGRRSNADPPGDLQLGGRVTVPATKLRAELELLRARHDSGAVAPAIYQTIKQLEREIAWREHAKQK
jgi:hypothetical protein